VDEYYYPNTRPFLLMEGGPLFRLQERAGLIKEAAPRIMLRALLAALLTWVPLLILSTIQGTEYGHKVAVSFLRDYGAYTRFLLALPLLLLAENTLGPRIAEAAAHFVTSGVVAEKDYVAFDDAVKDGLRKRDSVVAEIILLIIAYVLSIKTFVATAVHINTWYANWLGSDISLTPAGWWLILFCVPLYQFLLLRWCWRVFLWFRFLATMNKLDLQLFPTHPDESGGLGFVGEGQRFFGILLFAASVGSTGVIANSILYDKVPLTYYGPAIAVYAVFALLILVGPLAVFSPRLLVAKRRGLHQYGTLATAYSGTFYRKWILGQNPQQDSLLGAADIQSLADLGNSYGYIEKMNAFPIGLRSILHLLVAALLPMASLLLTVMPLKELIKLLFKVLV
jgi:hypothetical protein